MRKFPGVTGSAIRCSNSDYYAASERFLSTKRTECGNLVVFTKVKNYALIIFGNIM